MRRADREQDRAFALDVIDRCSFGVAAISTSEATPYCLPLSLVRVGESLYFHCAKAGRKLDLLRKNPRVCVTFVGNSQPAFLPEEDMYTDYFQSAMVVGTACEVTEDTEKIAALRALCTKLTPEGMAGDHFNRAIAASLSATGVWRIRIEELTGKAKRKT